VLPGLFDNLVFTAGALYLDAKYREFTDASGFGENGVFSADNNYTGNRVVRSPKWSGNVGLLQTWSGARGELEAAVDYYRTTDFYWSPKGTAEVREGGYGLLGARLSYLHSPTGLRVTVFGRNLTGARYRYSVFETDFGVISAGAPRESVGLRVSYDL
jgi:iron complex outermembrane recepter protein